ncbi:hypothetical protein M404DRAFT_9184 [Pisolithus tinctorius Marx 270]|uniref:Uncharacterized protein n=1 Tax=Pisolithus tinctorius Marx 270 TaxID=870435 RepID=A0A0C3NVN7_PISTI|nr:hypothetical protein M404DRAFT_9184 [Pisolithus tinctorius Marx 270]
MWTDSSSQYICIMQYVVDCTLVPISKKKRASVCHWCFKDESGETWEKMMWQVTSKNGILQCLAQHERWPGALWEMVDFKMPEVLEIAGIKSSPLHPKPSNVQCTKTGCMELKDLSWQFSNLVGSFVLRANENDGFEIWCRRGTTCHDPCDTSWWHIQANLTDSVEESDGTAKMVHDPPHI